MIQTDNSLPSKHVLKDKFNRRIKTFEDFRSTRIRLDDGSYMVAKGGKPIGFENVPKRDDLSKFPVSSKPKGGFQL